jgi:hypothetical protein
VDYFCEHTGECNSLFAIISWLDSYWGLSSKMDCRATLFHCKNHRRKSPSRASRGFETRWKSRISLSHNGFISKTIVLFKKSTQIQLEREGNMQIMKCVKLFPKPAEIKTKSDLPVCLAVEIVCVMLGNLASQTSIDCQFSSRSIDDLIGFC